MKRHYDTIVKKWKKKLNVILISQIDLGFNIYLK